MYMMFLGAAFGVRTLVHRRLTGSSGWLTPPTTAAWVGDVLFTVGVMTVAAAPMVDVLGSLPAAPALDHVAIDIAGVIVLAAGATVALTARAEMGVTWRAGIDLSDHDTLVTRGLFRVVRNPFYSGVLTASAGVALVVPSVVSAAGWLLVLIGCAIDVRLVEEPHLRRVPGSAFAAYE